MKLNQKDCSKREHFAKAPWKWQPICNAKEKLYLTCVYTIVLKILDVIVSKEVFTNLEEIEGKAITTKRVSSGVRLG